MASPTAAAVLCWPLITPAALGLRTPLSALLPEDISCPTPAACSSRNTTPTHPPPHDASRHGTSAPPTHPSPVRISHPGTSSLRSAAVHAIASSSAAASLPRHCSG